MSILVLGHGKYYKTDIRCSPIPIKEWINKQYISVDIDDKVYPDIVYDLTYFPYPFLNETFDIIIDTTGLGLSYLYKNKLFILEIQRILNKNGIFYGRKNFRITKT